MVADTKRLRRSVMHLLVIVLTKVSMIHGDQNLELMLNMTTPIVTIKCVIKQPNSQFKLKLFCPIVRPEKNAGGTQIDVPCFQDCQFSCQLNEEGLCKEQAGQESLKSIECNIDKDENRFIVSYKINTSIANTAGQWYCTYRTQSSSKINLHVANPIAKPTLRTTSTMEPPPTSISTSTFVNVNAKATSMTAALKEVYLVTNSFESVDGKQQLIINPYLHFAQAEYFIGALCIFGISFIINIVFILRCVLAKIYIGYKRSRHSAPGCLSKCLCISTIEVNHSRDSLYEDIEKPGQPSLFFNTSNITESTSIDESSYERPTSKSGMTARSNNSLSSTPVYQSPCSNKYLYMHSTDPRSGEHFVQRVIVYDDVHVSSEVGDSEYVRESISYKNKSTFQDHSKLQRSHSCSPVNVSGSFANSDGVSYIIEPRTSASSAPGGPSTHSSFFNGKVAPNRRFSGHVLHRTTAEPGIPEEVSFISKLETDDDEDDVETISARENFNGNEPKTSTRLELSRMMLKKADTLLREANSLLLK